MPASILVAEDDDLTRELLERVMRRDGHHVTGVADGAEALAALETRGFDLILSDIQMSGASGLELLERASVTMPDTPVVLITAYAEADAAMDAITRGAADYLAKPVDVALLRSTVMRALERRRLKSENRQLRREALDKNAIIGTSPAMLDLYKQIAQAAVSAATVLITGESGSGKELAARTIHQRSPQAKGPWVAVNCAAFTESLLETELFGHERGAFTGAHALHRGLFEEANGGTLFLDEIGDVPLKMQAQLLRVLQEGEVRRVGGVASIPVDVRIIAATNRDLSVEVAEKRMREDLYYRLDVVTLRVPPLRERADDVLSLARYFVARQANEIGRPIPEVSPEALARIRSYPWPGNVRELENALARAVAMSQGNVLLPSDLPPKVAMDPSQLGQPAIDSDWPALAELERRYIERVLARTDGNKTAAAAILGIDRRTLQRLFAREGGGDDPGS
ncbi:MAG TPA: sigma-54 dependent transcriptional regulator [Polyangia bacterium]|nr:sigma-54 dependent transcriptional regulator [Polyangia bacterium]